MELRLNSYWRDPAGALVALVALFVGCGSGSGAQGAPPSWRCEGVGAAGIKTWYYGGPRTARIQDNYWMVRSEVPCSERPGPCGEAPCRSLECKGPWTFRNDKMTFEAAEFRFVLAGSSMRDATLTSNSRGRRIPLTCVPE